MSMLVTIERVCGRSCGDAVRKVLGKFVDDLVMTTFGLSRLDRLLSGLSLLDLLLYSGAATNRRAESSHPIDSDTIAQVQRLLDHHSLHDLYKDRTNVRIATEVISQRLLVKESLRESLHKVLTQLRSAHKARSRIHALKEIQVDPTKHSGHKALLYELWTLLTQNKKVPPLRRTSSVVEVATDDTSTDRDEDTAMFISKSINDLINSNSETADEDDSLMWSSVGFQGEPVRDFRGCGLLGLTNLIYFARHHTARAQEVFRDSLNKDLWFPFAATGLNITVWLLRYLDEDKLNVFFFHNAARPTFEIFGIIYSFTFLEFSRFWKLSRPKDIMQFGDVSLRFRERLENTFSTLSTPKSHSEWNLQTTTGEDLTEELSSWIDGEVHPHHSGHILQKVMLGV